MFDKNDFDVWADRWGVTVTVRRADDNPDMLSPTTREDACWLSRSAHFVAEVAGRFGTSWHGYSVGEGIHRGRPDYVPAAADVLRAVADDCESVRDVTRFEDWAEWMGYDPDSRRAERVFELVERRADDLRGAVGADAYDDLFAALQSDREAGN